MFSLLRQWLPWLAALAAVLFSASPARAQNLVPNGSFELYAIDPTNMGMNGIRDGYCQSWSCPNTATSDYFHVLSSTAYSCTTGTPPYPSHPLVSAPANRFGEQPPLPTPTGAAYAGIYAYDGTNNNGLGYSEYLTVPINVPSAGDYLVSFKASLAEESNWAIDDIGAAVLSAPVSNTNPSRLDITALGLSRVHARSSMLNRADIWTTVSGKFTAPAGAYPSTFYLLIGSMSPMSSMHFESRAPLALCSNSNLTDAAYYYIDEVEVIPAPQGCSCNISLTPSSCNTNACSWGISMTAQSGCSFDRIVVTWDNAPANQNPSYINVGSSFDQMDPVKGWDIIGNQLVRNTPFDTSNTLVLGCVSIPPDVNVDPCTTKVMRFSFYNDSNLVCEQTVTVGKCSSCP
jgi:hypothetical protein